MKTGWLTTKDEIVQGSTTLCGQRGGPDLEEALELKKVGHVVDRDQNMIFVGLISDQAICLISRLVPNVVETLQGFTVIGRGLHFVKEAFKQEKVE